MKRTLAKETLTKVGEEVTLKGWVESVRAMGKMVFIDLRDRSGTVQCVAFRDDFEEKQESWSELKGVTQESVISITGAVKERENEQVNTDLEYGTVEITINEFELLNKAAALPIPVQGDGKDIREDARLEYRYLDLRRKRVQNIIKLRSRFIHAVRDALYEKDFTEIETPILTASTKEGARDFVVPSRLYPGKFYALPQSPQQYKQLLMTAGFENYFQIARCIRDEDLRADRGFEHTQIDVETSFRNEQEVRDLIEYVVTKAISEVGGKIREGKFETMTYAEVMEKYGDDKFDIRTPEEKEQGVLAFAWVTDYPMFKKVDAKDVAEVRDGKSGWTFTHNPFSGIKKEHEDFHKEGKKIEEIKATQYDLVCNGYEIGSGSVRNHSAELLRATFKIMGYSEEETQNSIGHMLKAFELGTPPHGGIALGVERLVMLLTGEDSLKETVAFPMTYQGRTAVMDAPNKLSQEQLDDLGISVKGQTNEPVKDQIVSFLKKNEIKHEYLEHEPAMTSEDAAKITGIPMGEGVKALILKGKKSGANILIAMRGSKRVDMSKLKALLGEEFEFEKPDMIFEKFGVKVGGVPPFGSILGIKHFIDSSVKDSDKVAFSAGDSKVTIVMSTSDYINVHPEAKIADLS